MVDGEAVGAEVAQKKLDLGDDGPDRGDVIALVDEVTFW